LHTLVIYIFLFHMRHLFICLLLSVVFSATAQDKTYYDRWSIGLNVGGSGGHAPIRIDRPAIYQPHMLQLNGRYMFTNRIGIMNSVQFNNFKIGDSGYRTNYINTKLSLVVNAGDIIKLYELHEDLGLLIHGGVGLAGMWQRGFFDSITPGQNPLWNKADDMLIWSFGFTPQYKINDRWSVNADLMFNFHFKQTRTFDFQNKNPRQGGINGYFLNFSFGVTRYLGIVKRHADWTPTTYGGDADMSSYEEKVKQLEREYNEKIKALEESMKVADADGDGVPDAHDLCPDKAGPWGFSGCPDTDGDGIPDHIDQCPDVYGSWKYQGCPEPSREIKEVLDRAVRGVNFETGRAVLTKESYPILDEVVKLMKEDKSYKLKITGHTDNVGTLEHNMKLSKDRAQAVEDYLESKGLDPDRFIVIGFGPTRPVASNDTPEGKAKNRRVEFTVVY
jgi:OmpA-OmpF porin, OOP family